MGRPMTLPPASAAAREATSMRPPYPPVIIVQPWAAMAAPVCSARAQRGSGGSSRADPTTPTNNGRGAAGGLVAGDPGSRGSWLGDSAGDELIATHPLSAGQGDDGAAQYPFGVLASGVDGQGPADLRLAARLVDVPVQAQHGLVFLQRVPDRGGADPGDHRHAAFHDRAEFPVEESCLVDGRVARRYVEVEDRPVGAAERLGLPVDIRGELFFGQFPGRVPGGLVRV